ncbi:MAG TPA: haloacid dehalogenase-like hydrolase [Dehalococcoidales bacterium]
MTCSAIVCDWNGTLFEDPDEEAIVREMTVSLAKSYLPWHPLKFARLIQTKNKLERMNNERHKDLEISRAFEMLRVYDEKVINGVPMSLVRRFVEKYSNRKDVQSKLVYRALRPVAERHRAGITTGILSAGYGYGIQMILKSAGYSDCFDFYEANLLAESEGKATGFAMKIYKNKAELLLGLLKDRNLDAKRTAYLGDSLDDAGCFEVIGHPIVSFLTPENLKEKFARKYGAFIPRRETELARYLGSI